MSRELLSGEPDDPQDGQPAGEVRPPDDRDAIELTLESPPEGPLPASAPEADQAQATADQPGRSGSGGQGEVEPGGELEPDRRPPWLALAAASLAVLIAVAIVGTHQARRVISQRALTDSTLLVLVFRAEPPSRTEPPGFFRGDLGYSRLGYGQRQPVARIPLELEIAAAGSVALTVEQLRLGSTDVRLAEPLRLEPGEHERRPALGFPDCSNRVPPDRGWADVSATGGATARIPVSGSWQLLTELIDSAVCMGADAGRLQAPVVVTRMRPRLDGALEVDLVAHPDRPANQVDVQLLADTAWELAVDPYAPISVARGERTRLTLHLTYTGCPDGVPQAKSVPSPPRNLIRIIDPAGPDVPVTRWLPPAGWEEEIAQRAAIAAAVHACTPV